jgi:hypothetical protein
MSSLHRVNSGVCSGIMPPNCTIDFQSSSSAKAEDPRVCILRSLGNSSWYAFEYHDDKGVCEWREIAGSSPAMTILTNSFRSATHAQRLAPESRRRLRRC